MQVTRCVVADVDLFNGGVFEILLKAVDVFIHSALVCLVVEANEKIELEGFGTRCFCRLAIKVGSNKKKGVYERKEYRFVLHYPLLYAKIFFLPELMLVECFYFLDGCCIVRAFVITVVHDAGKAKGKTKFFIGLASIV